MWGLPPAPVRPRGGGEPGAACGRLRGGVPAAPCRNSGKLGASCPAPCRALSRCTALRLRGCAPTAAVWAVERVCERASGISGVCPELGGFREECNALFAGMFPQPGVPDTHTQVDQCPELLCLQNQKLQVLGEPFCCVYEACSCLPACAFPVPLVPQPCPIPLHFAMDGLFPVFPFLLYPWPLSMLPCARPQSWPWLRCCHRRVYGNIDFTVCVLCKKSIFQ